MKTRTPAENCSTCGYLIDAASGIDHNEAPQPGDFSVCIKCGAVFRFADDLSQRECTDDDLDELDLDSRIKLLMCQSLARAGKMK